MHLSQQDVACLRFPVPPAAPFLRACLHALLRCGAVLVVHGVRRSDCLGRPSMRNSCSFFSTAVSSHCEHVFVAWVPRRCSAVRSSACASVMCPIYCVLRSSRVQLAGQLTQSWFAPHTRVPQAVDGMIFAYQACRNSGFSCSHVRCSWQVDILHVSAAKLLRTTLLIFLLCQLSTDTGSRQFVILACTARMR